MQRIFSLLALALGSVAAAQTNTNMDIKQPFRLLNGQASFQGCVLEQYGNYVDCFWNYTRTASGSAQLELDTKRLALYGVDGTAQNLFGYAIGAAPSGGTVV